MATDMKSMNSDLKGMAVDMKVMSGRLEKTVTVMEGMDRKLGETVKVMTGMDKKLSETVAEMVKMGTKLELTVSEMKKMSGKMDSMDKNLAETIKIMTSMEQQLVATVQKMTLMSENLEKTVSEIQKMGEKIEAMDEKLKEAVRLMDGMYEKLGTTVREIAAMSTKLDETVSEIKKMGGKMESMDKKLETTVSVMTDMSGKLDATLVVMRDMSNDAILGLSTILINESFKHLVEHKETFGAKLVTAGEYASAYAFQFLKDNSDETKAYRGDLYTAGLNMFFGHVKSLLYEGIASESPYREDESPSFDKSNQLANAYAIAFRMSEINPNQKKAKRVNRMEVQSILSVLKEGLQKHVEESKSGSSSSQKPEWVSGPIQNNLEVIKTLLQLRYNIFMLKVVSMVSDLGGVTSTPLMAQGKWVVNYAKATENIGMVQRANLMLMAALDAGMTLHLLGAKVVDLKIAKIIPASVIIKNMNLVKPSSIPKGMEEEVAKLEKNLKKLQDSYLNP